MLVRVGRAAKLLGVSVKTLPRCEASGKLLPTLRTLGGHRRYETSDLME
ncbi:MAG: MerR family DNA-binding transcriptional regulator [Promethearchaeota archaeon]